MTVANTKMKQWEQIQSLFETASGYASAISCHLASFMPTGCPDAHALREIHTACGINPQKELLLPDKVNNLYLETVTEFIRTYRALKNVIAKGGRQYAPTVRRGRRYESDKQFRTVEQKTPAVVE